MLDAGTHLFELVGFSAQAIDLGQARDAGPHLMPDHVAGDELPIELVVGNRVWSRAYHTHSALQDVDELRQLVERRLAQECTQRSYALIVSCYLRHLVTVLKNIHGSKLIDQNFLAIESVTSLSEQHWSGRSQLYGHGDPQHERRYHDQYERRENDVAGALDEPVCAVERGFTHSKHRYTADGFHARLNKVVQKNVGHKIDRRSCVVKITQQPQNAGLRSHGQRDVDQIDVMTFDVLGKLAQVAEIFVHFKVEIAVAAAIVEVAFKSDAKQRTCAQMHAEVAPGSICAGYYRRSLQPFCGQYPWQYEWNYPVGRKQSERRD